VLNLVVHIVTTRL